MNSASNTYYTLLASLPAMPADYRQPHVPISWPRLEDRLAMLDHEPREFVALLFALMDFDTSEAARSDTKQKAIYQKLAGAVTDEQLRELIDLFVDARDIVAALRARHQQQPPPSMLGNYAGHIKRNWQQPDFRLGLRFTWVNDVRHFLDSGQVSQAENALTVTIWRHLRRHGEGHNFSLPALVVYLMQWHLVSGWSARDAKIGMQRFTTFLGEATNGYDSSVN